MSSNTGINISRKRRAIFTGLYPFLEMENLLQAMVLWEQRYADNPSFAVQHFIKDICTTNQIESVRREILLNLVKTLAMPENELMKDPLKEIEYYRKQNNISFMAEYTSKDLLVFQKLIISLLEQTTVEKRISIKEFVLLQVQRNSSIDADLKRQLNLWLSKQISSMKVLTPEIESLRKIINFFYVAFCEHIGPVQTDKMLNNGVIKITDNQTNANTPILRKLL